MEQRLPVMNKPSLHIRLRNYFRAHKAELASRDSMMASLKSNLDQARKDINTLQQRNHYLSVQLSQLGGATSTYNPQTDWLRTHYYRPQFSASKHNQSLHQTTTGNGQCVFINTMIAILILGIVIVVAAPAYSILQTPLMTTYHCTHTSPLFPALPRFCRLPLLRGLLTRTRWTTIVAPSSLVAARHLVLVYGPGDIEVVAKFVGKC